MVRPNMQKHINTKAFDKVREALNAVHHVKWADWDLCVLVVLWAYRIVCKTLTAQAPPRLEYEVPKVIPIILGELRLCMIAPIDTMDHGTLEVEIQQGSFRLQEHEKERVRLRKKSTLVEVKVKRMGDKG